VEACHEWFTLRCKKLTKGLTSQLLFRGFTSRVQILKFLHQQGKINHIISSKFVAILKKNFLVFKRLQIFSVLLSFKIWFFVFSFSHCIYCYCLANLVYFLLIWAKIIKTRERSKVTI